MEQEKEAADNVRKAVVYLNNALHEASRAQLKVEIQGMTHKTIGYPDEQSFHVQIYRSV